MITCIPHGEDFDAKGTGQRITVKGKMGTLIISIEVDEDGYPVLDIASETQPEMKIITEEFVDGNSNNRTVIKDQLLVTIGWDG